jgi:hypothetical protein
LSNAGTIKKTAVSNFVKSQLLDANIDPSTVNLEQIATRLGVSPEYIKNEYAAQKKVANEEAAKLKVESYKNLPGSAQEFQYLNTLTPEKQAEYRKYQTEDANRKVSLARAGGTGGGGLTPYQEFQGGLSLGSKVDNLNKAAKEVANRAALAQQAYNRFANGEVKDLNATSQVIITNFNKILDPTSVVRESEYARSPEGQSYLAQLEGKLQQISQGGAGLTKDSLKEFIALGNAFAKNAQTSIEQERQRAVAYGNKYGIDTSYVGGGYVPPVLDMTEAAQIQKVIAPDGTEVIITD